MVWDNAQKLQKVRQSTSEEQNKMFLWANAYAALNRVDRSSLEDNKLRLRCADIPLTAYLPSPDDLDLIRLRMETLTSRILCQHIPHFRDYYGDVVDWHIEHQYSAQARLKSKTVIIDICVNIPNKD